jgi:hypothetical protein
VSKKDFVAIATALRAVLGETDSHEAHRVLFVAMERVADVCAASNDCFDRAKFLRACGM